MSLRTHAVLAPVSQGCPPPPDTFLRAPHPSAAGAEAPARLACVRHAASVRSEPGSNSQVRRAGPTPPKGGTRAARLPRGTGPARHSRRGAHTTPAQSRRARPTRFQKTDAVFKDPTRTPADPAKSRSPLRRGGQYLVQAGPSIKPPSPRRRPVGHGAATTTPRANTSRKGGGEPDGHAKEHGTGPSHRRLPAAPPEGEHRTGPTPPGPLDRGGRDLDPGPGRRNRKMRPRVKNRQCLPGPVPPGPR